MATFVISRMPNGNFQFHLKANNGEIILSSEPYVSKDAAMNGIISARSNSHRKDRYVLSQTDDGYFFFKLLAANGQVIGTSTLYTTAISRDTGIRSVMNHAIFAKVTDNISEEAPALKTTAQFVKEKRKQLELTQEDLALKAGVGLRFIRELEGGEKETLRIDKVNEVLKLFGYTLGPIKIDRS